MKISLTEQDAIHVEKGPWSCEGDPVHLRLGAGGRWLDLDTAAVTTTDHRVLLLDAEDAQTERTAASWVRRRTAFFRFQKMSFFSL